MPLGAALPAQGQDNPHGCSTRARGSSPWISALQRSEHKADVGYKRFTSICCKAVELIVSKDKASWLCRSFPPLKQPVRAQPAWYLCPAAPKAMLNLLLAGAISTSFIIIIII